MGSLPQPAPHERLAAILAICRKMNSERELGPLLDLIAREATSLLDCDRASIFLLDRERNELWSKAALGTDEILRFDARLGAAGEAVATDRTVNVGDACQDGRSYTGIDGQTGYPTRSVLAMALRNHEGEIIGAFEARNKRLGSFTARDEETLEALAAHTANAIETAQLIGELRRSRDELARQNANLCREAASRYAAPGMVGTNVAAIPKNLKRAIEELEREMIAQALAHTAKNQQRAARLLGLSRQGLINKLKRYGL